MDYSKLIKLPLFASLRPQELEQIFAELKITATHFRKGDILAMQGEPCNRLIILLAGSVKAEMTDPSGKVAKVEDISAPNPLAILFLFGSNSFFPVQAIAKEDVSALVIPKESVLRMLGMSAALLKNYLDISADFASRLSAKLHFMSFRTIRQKAAVYILELSKKAGSDSVEPDKTKTALAEYFAVSRPSLEREFTKMQREGLIVMEKKRIIITDRRKLAGIIR